MVDGGPPPRLLGCIHDHPPSQVWHDASTPGKGQARTCTMHGASRVGSPAPPAHEDEADDPRVHDECHHGTSGWHGGSNHGTAHEYPVVECQYQLLEEIGQGASATVRASAHNTTRHDTTRHDSKKKKNQKMDPQPTVDARRDGKPPRTKTKERHVTWTRKKKETKERDAMARRRRMENETLTACERGRRTHRRTVHDACPTTRSWP